MARTTAFPHLHIILQCEDYGSLLCPIAREQDPSCAAPVAPGSDETLLASAVKRLKPFTGEKIRVVTTLPLAPGLDALLAGSCGLKMEDYELLVQPTQRGSAFAIALAAARIRRLDPQAVVLVSRADQRVELDERWERVIFDAYQVALQDQIAVLGGVQETKCADWTYMRKGKPFPGVDQTFQLRLFSADQKPAAAKRICAQGAYWYTGMFLARAALLQGELKKAGSLASTPESRESHRIAEAANFLAQLDPRDWLNQAAKELIESLPLVSLEKALFEVSRRLVLVPTGVRFDALSSLEDLDSLSGPSHEGNRVVGEALLKRCRNTTVYSQGAKRTVVTLGLKDVMVVELDDMTLVVSKDQLDNIDDVRTELQQRGR